MILPCYTEFDYSIQIVLYLGVEFIFNFAKKVFFHPVITISKVTVCACRPCSCLNFSQISDTTPFLAPAVVNTSFAIFFSNYEAINLF